MSFKRVVISCVFICFTLLRAHASGATFTERVQALAIENDCDRKQNSIRLWLANIMDQQRDEIENVFIKNPASPTQTYSDLGPLSVGTYVGRETSADKWIEERFDWFELEKVYNEIYDKPVNASWVALYMDFKLLLANDESRISFSESYPSPAEALLHEKPRRVFPFIKRLDQGTFEVPLYAGDMVGYEKELSELIEKEWSSNEYKIKIRWLESKHDHYFKIQILNPPQVRSYVDSDTKDMHLAKIVRKKSIAHEFGHVLGFRDSYHEFRDEVNCRQGDIYNKADIMSEPNTGRVLPYHWEWLDKTYPLQ